MAGAIVGALLLLTILSPLGLIVALLLLGVSVIALITYAAQRRPVKKWGICAVASLIFAFALAGTSDSIYGTGLPGDADSSLGKGTESPGEPNTKNEVESKKSREKATPSNRDVIPELQDMAERWRSKDGTDPLLVPRYLPFKDDSVHPGDKGYSLVGANQSVDLSLPDGNSGYYSADPSKRTIYIDRRPYYWVDQSMAGTSGVYSVAFWERGTVVPVYRLSMYDTKFLDPEGPKKFMMMFESMDRVEPSG